MSDFRMPQFVVRDFEVIRPIMREVFSNLLSQVGKSMDDPVDMEEINEKIELLRAESSERNRDSYMETLRTVGAKEGLEKAIKAVQDQKAYGPHERVLMGLCTEYDRIGFTFEQVKTAFTDVFAERELDFVDVFPWLPAVMSDKPVWEPPPVER